MTIVPRRHQHPVHHLPAIILDRIARERGHSTIRFVHDQIAAARSQSRLWPPAKAASSLPSATRHSRSASDPIRGCSVISSGDGLSRCTSGFGPATREKSSSVPVAARTGLSLCVAPLAADGEEELVGGRRKHRRQHRRRARDQRHTDAPVLAAGEIGAGAVDRIDDPDQFLAEAAVVVDALFRQPAIIRRRRAQPPFDEIVDGDVGLGDRRRGALGPVLQFGAKQRQRQRAGLAHGIPQQRGIARPDRCRRYQRPPSVRPSMRSVGALTP